MDSVFIHRADRSSNRSNGKTGVRDDVEDLLAAIYDHEACVQDATTREVKDLCAAAVGFNLVSTASGTVNIGRSVDVRAADLREIAIAIEIN